jgi:xylulokinase
MKKTRLSLGLDISTQGIKAVVLDIDRHTKTFEHSLDYCQDSRLNTFGIRKEDYILPPESEGEASQPPELFFAALDAIFSDLKQAVSLRDIVVINNSSQQHGHVYLNKKAAAVFQRLLKGDSTSSDLVALLKDGLAHNRAPIWMTSNTTEQTEHIRRYVGGKDIAIKLSGSDIPLRFTGPIIRRIARQFPDIYIRAEIIQLISSLVTAILTGNAKTAIDYGNACGMALMDYRQKKWSDTLIKATADDLHGGDKALLKKLPPIVAPNKIVGKIALYFVEKYGYLPSCRIMAGSGDNPQSKILVHGDLLSLGSSLVNMVSTDGKTFDMNGYANAMYDGLGRPFIFGCRTNGTIVWDRLRALYGLNKQEYSHAEQALKQTPIGQYMVFWQPRDESFPPSAIMDMVRVGYEKPSLGADYAGLIETTLASVYYHSQGFTRETSQPLYITGGAGSSREIIRRVAAIWNRPVVSLDEGGAALGAAIAGAHAFSKSRQKLEFVKSSQSIQPRPEDVAVFHRPGGFLDIFIQEEIKLLA